MHYYLSILFFLKKGKKDKAGRTPIYCRITVNGERAELSANEKIEIVRWDSRLQRAKGRSESARVLNNHLDIIESKIKKQYNNLIEGSDEISSIIIRDLLTGKRQKEHYLLKVFGENNKLVKQEEGNKYSTSTVNQYITTLNRLKIFIQKEYSISDIELLKLDITFIRRFEIFLKTEYSIDHNTIMKYLKQLKKVIHFAMEIDYIERDPFLQYKTAYKEVNRGYLTSDELKRIEEKKFRIKRLDQVRDVFVWVCYTGLSYSDLKKLTTESITRGIDGKNWIIYEREKTGVRASIPLLPTAQKIIDKYKDDPECIADNKILPVKSNQKLNSYLAEIAELCEIDKHVTMHLGRHTFATTVTLSQGVPIETVQKMLGHRLLATTAIYSRVVDTKISEDMGKIEEKLCKQQQNTAPREINY